MITALLLLTVSLDKSGNRFINIFHVKIGWKDDGDGLRWTQKGGQSRDGENPAISLN